ncbi:MAG TPA: DUF488 family protein [Acidimicrobiales bacterium]|nr:DUF488 family protein [Acidimicrobiales bacterium]
MSVAIARVYDPPTGRDRRVLVDRLWPRGLSKERAALELWAKDVAPSPELRVWYDHDPDRFTEFARRYRAELTKSPAYEQLLLLHRWSRRSRVLLLTATRDLDLSGPAVLQSVLEKMASNPVR